MQKIRIYWRDIPSQVLVKQGRKRGKVMLSERFQAAIDRAAMRAGRGSSDAYMADWRREYTGAEAGADMQSLADQDAALLEQEYSDERLTQLIRNKGFESAEDS